MKQKELKDINGQTNKTKSGKFMLIFDFNFFVNLRARNISKKAGI